jgi:hypothetical protein
MVKVKLTVLIQHYTIKTCKGNAVLLHEFLALALDGDEWSASSPGHFSPE